MNRFWYYASKEKKRKEKPEGKNSMQKRPKGEPVFGVMN